MFDVRCWVFDVRLATASPSFGGHGEWSALGSRDIDHRTRGATVRERDAIESIRASADLPLLHSNRRYPIQRFNPSTPSISGFSMRGCLPILRQ